MTAKRKGLFIIIPMAILCMLCMGYRNAPSPGSWALLETQDVSSVATVDFTSLPTAYRDFKVVISDVVPVMDGSELWARASVSASFKSGASDYAWAKTEISTVPAESNNGDASDSEWTISPPMGSAAGESGSLTFILFNPANTANRAKIMVDGSAEHSDGSLRRYMAGGRAVGTFGTSAVDGIQFLFNSGNIESGTFTLYGRMN